MSSLPAPVFLSAILLLSVLHPAPAAQAGRILEPAQMEGDLFTLSDAFVAEHAGRLRYASEEELDEIFGQALFEISGERTLLEFFRIVSRVVAAVRCGHTRVELGGLAESQALEAAGLPPLEILLEGERAWVLRSLDGALEPGAEIASIDGCTMAEIRATAFGRMSGDGFIETGKQRRLERDFARLYVLLVQAPERIGRDYEIRLTGTAELVRVSGLSPTEFAARAAAREPRPLMRLTLLPEGDLAVLSVSQFGDRTGEPSFSEQLAENFRRANESGVGHLVVDLRGNGGGNDNYGAELVSYMATREFGYFERIEVTADYDGPGGVVEQNGRRLVTEHRSLRPWEPAEHRFRGQVFLLEDGWTFSTAADVATVAHHNGFATLVGEESGGGYDGNTSGFSGRVPLPESGLSVSLPKWMYVTANQGHAYPGRGAIPDHTVPTTIEDALSERDAQLEFVRERIRKASSR